MITLPTGLDAFMKGQNLDGLKPFAFLFRNKWDSVNNKYVLDTTPIDISALIVKPNTLSMTLDVNEVAQYNANNVTLTLSDTKNYFVEGTPNSYFPDGYQLYGSRVVLYYGTDDTNRTPLFTGVIKDLPTHKPEQYQVELKLVSPLEMLKDIEAKDFSDKVTGEELTYEHTEDQHKVYSTAGTGVGGFDAVYADGTKLFEGVDYEISQTNALGLPALVTITNSNYYNSTITADYYTWKTNLTVEKIVAGLIDLAGYNSTNEDIRSVVWNNQVRTQRALNASFTLGYRENSNNYEYSGNNIFFGGGVNGGTAYYRYSILPTNFNMSFTAYVRRIDRTHYFIGDLSNGNPYNGFEILLAGSVFSHRINVNKYDNGNVTLLGVVSVGMDAPNGISISKNGSNITINVNGNVISSTVNFTGTGQYNERVYKEVSDANASFSGNSLTDLDTGITLSNDGVCFSPIQKLTNTDVWTAFQAILSNQESQYTASFRSSENGSTWGNFNPISISSTIGSSAEYIQFVLSITTPFQNTNISNAEVDILTNELTLQLVNLSDKTVLASLQDFALISGYEFGVDRQGVFFFRPRVASTTPTYILDHEEIVKVDTVKKNLSDFFTKLTLTFAQVPLEFYANTGDRPTLVDKYGIINKEIDKPDIVNYENPELAQAIGPQLLEVYSSLPNIIQVSGKLNLALELGDIVSLRRNMNLITPENYTDYSKYTDLNTYYRACKITGMNYNFSKRQITYTLRDVSNKNTEPQYEFNEYIYDYQVQFGVKE